MWAQSMKLALTKLDVVIAKKISLIINVTAAGKDFMDILFVKVHHL